MKLRLTKGQITVILVTAVIVIDQIIKFLVKTNMRLGQEIDITGWFSILFTENPGMAFGMEIFGKLFLTLFRIVFVIIFAWFIHRTIKRGFKTGFVVCLALILAGALGNIIDSVFYGVFFSESTRYQVATFLPEGGGYASWCYGKVVDMFYFPIIQTVWPEWVPYFGGNQFIFFSPIFNFADAAISCGIIALLIFYSKHLNAAFQIGTTEHEEKKK